MDAKLKSEFVHVHQNTGEGNVLSSRVVEDLLGLNGQDCTVTEHAGTISIACQSLEGLGKLAGLCTGGEREGPDLRFFGSLRTALVKFIG